MRVLLSWSSALDSGHKTQASVIVLVSFTLLVPVFNNPGMYLNLLF